MSTMRLATERFFERWSEFVVNHRWLVVFAVLGATAAIVPQIRHGWLDVSTESYLPKKDQTIIDYNNFRRQYGYGNPAMLTIKVPDTIFTLKNLARIKALHEEVEKQVPYIEDITSLVNVRYTRGVGDALLIDDLVELWPTTEEQMPAFKQMVLNNPNYVGGIISEDGKVASISIKPIRYSSAHMKELEAQANQLDALLDGFDEPAADVANKNKKKALEFISPEEELGFSKSIVEIYQKYHKPGVFEVYGTGGTIMNYKMAHDMEKAMTQSVQLGMAIIVILLGLLFRRVSGVVMPLMVVSLSILTTMALWPVLGYAFNGNTQIIPTFLLAVGIADAVHILSIFYRRYDNGEDKHEAIVNSMKQTAVAVVMTTVTTAASLLSFMAAELLPTQTMGLFGAIGVVLALVYTMLLMPSLLAILPIKRKGAKDVIEHTEGHSKGIMGVIDNMIFFLGDLGVRRARSVVFVASVVGLIALIGVAQVRFGHDPIRWYPEDAELRVAVETVDAHMDGTLTQQVLFDTGRANGLYEPEVLKLLEAAEELVKNHHLNGTQAKDVISVLSVVKETHQALNQNQAQFHVIPDDRETIAQELLLFENGGTDDLEEFTDTTFQHARLAAQMPWSNVINYRQYNQELQAKLEQLVADSGLQGVSVKVVGLLAVFGKAIHVLLIGTVESYLIAFALVALLMILLMGNLRRGLLAFSPNILPILVVVGLLGWIGTDLNILTSMVGAIIIGISVDDTIHFMHHFRRYSLEGHDARSAVHKTLETCGRAITFTSIVLVGGFIVHALDSFLTSKQFGYLLSLAILLALIANLLLAPALMTLFWKDERADSSLTD